MSHRAPNRPDVGPTNLFFNNDGGVNRTGKRLLTRPEKNCKRNFDMTQEAKASDKKQKSTLLTEQGWLRLS
ncbi:hypothetical protein [Polaromonas sp. C04]|uniref:hypothetical protein n=1 Tax=Polaromonas sp. C04 TaxID=1945857 RepID=UPI0011858144|nr:hypothetical protein [Polaromonas sp. C04]